MSNDNIWRKPDKQEKCAVEEFLKERAALPPGHPRKNDLPMISCRCKKCTINLLGD